MSETVVTFAGSGDTFGSGGRLQTCIHVETPATTFLVDCGASALPALKRLDVEPNDIETILVTHLHGDHFGGIPFFVLDAQLVSKRSAPLTVAGPPGIEGRLRDAMDALFPGLSDVEQAFELDVVELDAGVAETLGDLRVTPYEVVHPSGAPPFALRVETDDATLGYSGDTEWTDALRDAARGTDLFVCEAYFYEKAVPYHLDYATLRDRRAELDCERLVVTHMSADLLGRLDDVECEAADDGKSIRV